MKDVFNKYKNTLQRKHSLEVKQFRTEKHIEKHRSDYQTIIANEKLKAEIARCEHKLTALRKGLNSDEFIVFFR